MNRLNSVSRTRSSSAGGILNRLSGAGTTALRGAYSVRRLSSTYTGPTMNVRRGSDNATSDFYGNFTGTALGTSLDAGGTSLSSWLGGATGFVTQWHDQSGTGNHATQSTTGSQPIINATTLLIDFRTLRIFNLPDGTLTTGNNKWTCVVRHGAVRNADGPNFVSAGAQNTNNTSFLLMRGLGSASNYSVVIWGTGTHVASGAYADNSVVTFMYNQSNVQIFKNGSQVASVARSGVNVTSIYNRIGGWAGQTGAAQAGYALDGDLYNVFIFNTDISSTDRNLCESV